MRLWWWDDDDDALNVVCKSHTRQAARLLEPSQPLGVMAAAADEFIKTFGATNVCVYMPEAGR